MVLRVVTGIMLAAVGSIACKEMQDEKQKNGQQPAQTNQVNNSSNPNSNNGESDGDAFYTGFDGKTDFSLLLPNFRNISVQDASIAKVEQVEVALSEATINELVNAFKAKNPDVDVERFKRGFTRKRTTYRVIPLKAGTTYLNTSSPNGMGGRGGPGRPNDSWSKGSQIKLVISNYAANQVAAGQRRYSTDGGGGNLRACKSCHESGDQGAPPHELGRIMEVSDASALQWIKTGKAVGRTARIQHTWEFSADDEESGIVAYVRSRQTHDVEALTKLYVEQAIEEGGMLGGRGPGGPDGPQGPTAVSPSPSPSASAK